MNIFFRVDASSLIGTGHIMRCLTLADELASKGAHISFISRSLPGHMNEYVAEKGYRVYNIELNEKDVPFCWSEDAIKTLEFMAKNKQSVDWLVIDHYQIDWNWEGVLRPHVSQIAVIDDLADRKHDCDVLLDQNLYERMESRYKDLTPSNCIKLLGPANVLLRQEFYEARETVRERTGKINRLLVFFGGSDPTDETSKTLSALLSISKTDWTIDVVVGNANDRKHEIEAICESKEYINFYCQTSNIASLMSKADLAIGAGGSATWERMFLGLPTLTIVIADNQLEVTEVLEQKGFVWSLGKSEETSSQLVKEKVLELIDSEEEIRQMSRKSLRFMNYDPGMEHSMLAKVIMEGS